MSTAPGASAPRAGDEGIDHMVAAPGGTAAGRLGTGRPAMVLVAESTDVFRSAARLLIEQRHGPTVVEAADLDGLISLAASAEPDIALVDFDLPPLGGVAGISYLAERHPSTRVIAWIASPSPAKVFEAVRAGATGCLEKELSAVRFHDALVGAERGEAALSARCAGLLVAGVQGDAERREFEERAARLTERERDVIALLAAGLRNREIAARLYITVATVKHHVSSILRKLEKRTRREAAEFYRTFAPAALDADRQAPRAAGHVAPLETSETAVLSEKRLPEPRASR